MTLKNNVFFKTVLLSTSIVLLLAVTILVQPKTACAVGVPAPTSCDPEYMDALEARAYMEAQREIAQNKNLIFKPDSVLEYTCFKSYLDHLAGAANMFSESGCCGVGGLGGGSLDSALQSAVGQALNTYLGNNFNAREFLDARSGVAKTPLAGVSGGTYACNIMESVWEAAKCMNFNSEDDHDGFYDFKWYEDFDPRTFNLSLAKVGGAPSVWDNSNNRGGSTTRNSCGAGFISAGDRNVAYNNREANYVLPVENPWSDYNAANDFTPYTDDAVNSYFNLILPLGDTIPGTATTVTCAAPILTGVCVNRGPTSTPYPDGVCPNPGCHYQPPAGTSCTSSPTATWCVGP